MDIQEGGRVINGIGSLVPNDECDVDGSWITGSVDECERVGPVATNPDLAVIGEGVDSLASHSYVGHVFTVRMIEPGNES